MSIINEADMSVIVIPNTPHKDFAKETRGLSSQILPLSRLSLSSGGGSPNDGSSSDEKSPNPSIKGPNTTETSPNNPAGSNQDCQSDEDESQKFRTPVREKISTLRRTLTEPLFQYFHHDLQNSPNSEEPDMLNTPRSIVPPISMSPVLGQQAGCLPKRNLLESLDKEASERAIDCEEFSDDGQEQDRSLPYIDLPPPPIVTDM